MESSLFNSISPVLDTSRLNLYYDKYKYKVKIKFTGIHYFRYERNVESFEHKLSQHVYRKFTHPLILGNKFPIIVGDKLDRYVTLQELLQDQYGLDIEIYKNYLNWRSKNREIRINITYDKLDVYVNDLNKISELIELLPESFDLKFYFVQPQPDFQRNCIYHLHPVNKHRIFFKLKRLEYSDIKSLREFMDSHDCKPSISLKNELYRALNTLSSYALILNHHYVDLRQEEYISLWALKYPDMVRCVFDIKQR